MADIISFGTVLAGSAVSLINFTGSSSPAIAPVLLGAVLTLVATVPNYIVFTSYNWPTDLLATGNPANPCGSSNPAFTTFDYIIVGAGTAGSVLANRLSEDPSVRVLLIEAGDVQTPFSVPPALFTAAFNTTSWPYRGAVTPDSCNILKNGAVYPMGKVLGGSTAVNVMIYACGADRDYNNMADTIGDPKFSYFNLLKYRIKGEANQDPSKDPKFHGFYGPLAVSTQPSAFNDSITQAIQSGWQQLNYPYQSDFNTNQTYNGVFETQFTIDGGERCSAAKAYLLPKHFQRPNLFIMRNSLVTKVNFSPLKAATGVQVMTPYASCTTLTMNAKKEVILSAGAFNSPKILMQSGIGRASDLSPFGIAQIADLPVGYNLMDHVCGINFIALNYTQNVPTFIDGAVDGLNYVFFRTGTFSNNQGVLRLQAFLNLTSTSARYPDTQVTNFFFPKQFPLTQSALTDFGLKDEYPVSRGTVKLRSNNPQDPPIINTGFFSDPAGVDLAKHIAGLKKIQQFIATSAISRFSPEFLKFESLTNCDAAGPFNSDAYWSCYRKIFTSTIWHPSGTARLGSKTDPKAVLEPNFKVKGLIANLRVVDASVFPMIPSSNTQCPVYMFAEYAADVIKSDSSRMIKSKSRK